MTGTLGLNIPSVSDCGAQASHGEAGVAHSTHSVFALWERVGGRQKAVSTSTGSPVSARGWFSSISKINGHCMDFQKEKKIVFSKT